MVARFLLTSRPTGDPAPVTRHVFPLISTPLAFVATITNLDHVAGILVLVSAAVSGEDRA
jgi:hypothetical protein